MALWSSGTRAPQPTAGETRSHTVNAEPSNIDQHPTGLRGHDVVDPSRRLIGTISNVVHDGDGRPEWAVVDLGLLRSAHYLPIAAGYMSEAGEFVVPYDKQIVKTAPKADRSHSVDRRTLHELHRHYELI